MKHYLLLALSAVALFMLAAPNAFALRRITLDPIPSHTAGITGIDPVCTQNEPCNIFYVGDIYQATFVPCSDLPADVDTTGFDSCLWLNNVTGSAVSSFDFTMAVPTGDGGQGLECSGSPSSVIPTECPLLLPSDGDIFDVGFLSNPALPSNTDFYLLTDFAYTPGTTADVTVSVPEPGEPGLFGLGLLAVGVGYDLHRRRRTPRTQEAA